MRNRTKLLLTALTAACVLATAVGTASARRFEISSQPIRLTWTSLRFTESTSAARPLEVRCPVTLEGSFHSKTISKVCGQLIGLITRAHLGPRRANCTFNNSVEDVRILNGGSGEGEETTSTLPWRILYVSFTGTLPRITRIRMKLLGIGFKLTALSTQCLYRSRETSPAFGEAMVNETTGEVTELAADRTRPIPKSSGGIICPSQFFVEGNARVTALETTTAITIKLVQ